MIMRFELEGKIVVLKGVKNKRLKVVEGECQKRSLREDVQFCLIQVKDQVEDE